MVYIMYDVHNMYNVGSEYGKFCTSGETTRSYPGIFGLNAYHPNNLVVTAHMHLPVRAQRSQTRISTPSRLPPCLQRCQNNHSKKMWYSVTPIFESVYGSTSALQVGGWVGALFSRFCGTNHKHSLTIWILYSVNNSQYLYFENNSPTIKGENG